MVSSTKMFAGIALAAGMVAASGWTAAFAGPCSDQIASMSKTLSDSSALGAVTTGTLTGNTPAANLKSADGSATPDTTQQAQGTSATGKLGGEGGTKEMSAASNQVATSAQDVRRQQAGMPTMAADPNAKLSDSDARTSMAKTALARARALDAKGDESCKASIDEAQKLMQKG